MIRKMIFLGLVLASQGCAQKADPAEASLAIKVRKAWEDSISLQRFSNQVFSGTDLTRGRVLDDNAIYTRYFITYKSGLLTISGIMNVPKGKGPFPVLILNHGYIPPKIYTNGRGLKREQDYLARRGYVVIHPDYRNHAQSDKDTVNSPRFRLTYVEDVVNAVLAVKNSDLPFLDKNRIGMLGHSMGGGIALNIMVTKPDLVQAFVLFGTVSADIVDNFYHWDANRPGLKAEIFDRYGSPEENPSFWRNLSPLYHFDRVTKAVQIHHAITDESCPVDWARKIRDSLQVQEKNVSYFEYPNEKHEFINAWPLVMERTAGFFDQYLKNHTDGI